MFAPLHILSYYSLLKSGLSNKKIAETIKSNNFVGGAIADEGTLSGVPEFIKEMEKVGKKYLVGLSLPTLDYEVSFYALNEEGYLHLIKMSSLFLNDKFDPALLKDDHSGLIAVVDSIRGKFKSEFEKNDYPSFAKELIKLNDLVDELYIGLEITSKEGIEYANKVREFAKEYAYSTIAFPKIRYEKKEDAIIIKMLEAVDLQQPLEERTLEGQEYFYSEENLNKIYSKQELELSVELINKSTFDYHKKRGHILKFPVDDSIKTLKEISEQGLKDKGIFDEAHIERLNMELDVIITMGYADYFLITQDYVHFAKTHDVLVGPGRGSSAGSLVAYALDITEVDPLKYNLSFERFLNIARKSMPDIDVDFMDSKRDLVIDYLREKYGEDKVAIIITFTTIGAKQALRDIGKILQIPERHISMLSKLVDQKMSLREAYVKVPAFKKIIDSDKYFLDIVTFASKIEGFPRHTSTHASGVILSDQSLINGIPASYDLENHLITQYEAEYLEEQGFLKMDFLAITNLSTIDYCCELVNKNPNNKPVDKWNIPYEDPNIFKLISSGMTMGLFQLESSGMNRVIRKMQPSCFNDVAALLALFRPGPMGNIDTFIKRKEGKEIPKFLSKQLEEVLSSTYGIIIYQEQISQIAMKMAGFIPTEADVFRAAVSKKKADVLAAQKENFIKGCTNNGYSLKDATIYFDGLLKFASYGLNKSHAVVYAITACRMAYLKYYYPLEFYISILATASANSDTKFSDYVSEIKRRNLNVFKPDINKSNSEFVIVEGGLLFPLNGIKDINAQLSNNIVNERDEKGEFKDFFDFVLRMYKHHITREQLTSLIDSGAFDLLYHSRASLRETALSALQFAQLNYSNNGQMLFDITQISKPMMFEEKDDPIENLEREQSAIGIMLSDNPLRYKKDLLLKYHTIELANVEEHEGNITVAGIIRNKKTITTRANKKEMAFLTIFDESGEMEIVIFPKVFEKCISILDKNNIVLVQGHYEFKDGKGSILADSVSLLEGEEDE